MHVFGRILLAGLILAGGAVVSNSSEPPLESGSKVYVLPIRDDIMPPILYVVRRGVKEAMNAGADVLILDMDTNGGRVDTTEELIDVLNQFKGRTVTYVNRKAFSAGAFIAVATQKIYMAPEAVIGAAAPLLLGPGGGVEMPETMEAKITSGIAALVRASAEKNGHNPEVIEAMIDKNKRLEIDGEVLSDKGEILTLTSRQAAKEYGNPPRPLLSSGTVGTLSELLEELGLSGASVTRVDPTGVERIATWINRISPILLIIGLLGVYIEFKTPGFGLPGIVGLISFLTYFFGGYIAGLSGMEWLALFFLGLMLLVLEIFVFTGALFLGLAGAVCMLSAIVMAMVDVYPGGTDFPLSMRVRIPVDEILLNLVVTTAGTIGAVWLAGRYLPRTSIYQKLVSTSVSGGSSSAIEEAARNGQVGEEGIAISALRPGGKAQFGDRIVDVITQGEMAAKGSRVRILRFSGMQPVVEVVADRSRSVR